MNKEIELEADKYARRFEENELSGYNGESLSIEDRMEMEAFIAGATSRYVEKQKLEFTIKELMWVNILIPFEHQYAKNCIDNKIKELEQKLSEL